jgi:hypothetical protein
MRMDFALLLKRLRGGDSASIPLLRLAALAAWLAAAIVVTQTAARSRETPGRIRTRLAELKNLEVQDARLLAWQAAEASFNRMPHGEHPFDLPAQAARVTGGTETNQVRELSRTPIAGGWEAVRLQVRAENMALGALSPLIEAAESSDPAWRLASFSIEPLSPKPGKGRVSLEFETLGRATRGQ